MWSVSLGSCGDAVSGRSRFTSAGKRSKADRTFLATSVACALPAAHPRAAGLTTQAPGSGGKESPCVAMAPPSNARSSRSTTRSLAPRSRQDAQPFAQSDPGLDREGRRRRSRRRGRSRRHASRVRSPDRRSRTPVGRQALVIELLKGGCGRETVAETRAYVRDHRPLGLIVARGCELTGIARSSFYAEPAAGPAEAAVAEIRAICEASPTSSGSPTSPSSPWRAASPTSR